MGEFIPKLKGWLIPRFKGRRIPELTGWLIFREKRGHDT
jgi:hypothetical protein